MLPVLQTRHVSSGASLVCVFMYCVIVYHIFASSLSLLFLVLLSLPLSARYVRSCASQCRHTCTQVVEVWGGPGERGGVVATRVRRRGTDFTRHGRKGAVSKPLHDFSAKAGGYVVRHHGMRGGFREARVSGSRYLRLPEYCSCHAIFWRPRARTGRRSGLGMFFLLGAASSFLCVVAFFDICMPFWLLQVLPNTQEAAKVLRERGGDYGHVDRRCDLHDLLPQPSGGTNYLPIHHDCCQPVVEAGLHASLHLTFLSSACAFASSARMVDKHVDFLFSVPSFLRALLFFVRSRDKIKPNNTTTLAPNRQPFGAVGLHGGSRGRLRHRH